MKVSHKATLIIACISIVLYSALAATCAYNAQKFWQMLSGRLEAGYYARAKFWFFIVLGASAILELPTFLGCVIAGGPYGCVWDEDETHNLVWCSHMFATCGFMYSVISTVTLWSDVIQRKDGNFFYSSSPLDNTKLYFRLAFIMYCIVVLVTMVAVMIEEKTNPNKEAYAHSHEIGAISYCIVPIMLVIITGGCFYAGIRLEEHVFKAQLSSTTLKKIFWNLNLTMLTICASYTLRAILVISLYKSIPTTYADALSPTWHYVIWIPLTQWFSYVVCSFCLVEQMRFRPLDRHSESMGKQQVELHDQGHQQQGDDRTWSKDSTASDISAGLRMTVASTGADGPWKTFLNLEDGGGDLRQSLNYFDAQSNGGTAGNHGKGGEAISPPTLDTGVMDHFFTTNALHTQARRSSASSSMMASSFT